MDYKEFDIEGLLLIKPKLFFDSRGYFFESYNESKYESINLGKAIFVQDNISFSKKGVLRGLHFQNPPFAQGKLVSVLKGSVLDVAVDLRKDSKTYGQYEKVLLNAESHEQFYIPEGFAHGFVALENDTIFSYKCTNNYEPSAERTIAWNDPNLNIDWGCNDVIVSDKDNEGELFINFTTPF